MANTTSKKSSGTTKKTASNKPAAKKGGGAQSKPAAKKPASRSAAPAASPRTPRDYRGLLAGLSCFLALFTVIGLFSADALFIRSFCGTLKGLIGYGYYLLPVALLAAAVLLLLRRIQPVVFRVVCLLLCPGVLGALVHVLANGGMGVGSGTMDAFYKALYESGQALQSGGLLGGLLGWSLRSLFSPWGAVPVLVFVLGALIVLAFRVSPRKVAQKLMEERRQRRPILEEPPLPKRPQSEPAAPERRREPKSAPVVHTAQNQRNARHSIDISLEDEPAAPKQADGEDDVEIPGFFNAKPRVRTPAEVLTAHAESQSVAPPSAAPVVPAPAAAKPVRPAPAAPRASAARKPMPKVEPLSIEEAASIAGVDLTPKQPESPVHTEEFTTAEVRDKRSAARKGIDPVALQQETDAVAKAVEQKNAETQPVYHFPPVDLLERGPGGDVDATEELEINSERLQRTLDSFGVGANLTDITRGPTVTRYDLELDTGVRLNKLTNLAGDIALSLGVSGVRIAPIEGRSSMVGIEVPNKIVSTVYLRDIIDTETFRRAPSKLSFALGKDISGDAIVGNIAKLPHLLIAGTTGSGKSVCMNCLILSLLYKSTPEEVRLIMIDPKMVELGIYNGVPHLYVPVVTDPKKAAGSLQWSVVEMLKRYRMFSEMGVRDLAGYNAIQRRNNADTLPQVVIIIDELADLMMVASKEVEESICRVAQMGRAAGMHLVIATQRPSADVITGLMKANIPSRIAFAVSSAMESRIILDQAGAEKLVGHGDMLYAPIGTGKPPRIQGAFVSDEEREEIVNFIKANGEANYDPEIQSSIDAAAAEKEKEKDKGSRAESVEETESGDFDELLPQAVDVVFETKQASVSMLQRRLKLGYSRAARIVDQMEEIGVVGPFEGSKPRRILLTREQWLEMQTVQGTAPVEQLPEQTSFADYQDAPPEEWKDE